MLGALVQRRNRFGTSRSGFCTPTPNRSFNAAVDFPVLSNVGEINVGTVVADFPRCIFANKLAKEAEGGTSTSRLLQTPDFRRLRPRSSRLLQAMFEIRYRINVPQKGQGENIMRARIFVMVPMGILALSISAFGQLPTTKILTLGVAQTIAQETLAKCRADGYKVTVLVVDGLNSPKALLRDDGAMAATAENVRLKATSVMLYNRPSGPPPNLPPGAPVPPPTLPGTSNGMGGVPITVDGVVIGAVAVSGAPGGDKDAACANSALAKVADRLR